MDSKVRTASSACSSRSIDSTPVMTTEAGKASA
jgi:hypothetical protein